MLAILLDELCELFLGLSVVYVFKVICILDKKLQHLDLLLACKADGPEEHHSREEQQVVDPDAGVSHRCGPSGDQRANFIDFVLLPVLDKRLLFLLL